MCSLEAQLLDAPVEKFGDIKLAFAGAGDFVNPAKLAKLFAGLAENAENLTFESHFVNAAGKCIRGVENLIRSGRDADSPRSAGRHGSGGRGRLVADGRASVSGSGHINGELTKEFSRGV